jgi:hypothetical protein
MPLSEVNETVAGFVNAGVLAIPGVPIVGALYASTLEDTIQVAPDLIYSAETLMTDMTEEMIAYAVTEGGTVGVSETAMTLAQDLAYFADTVGEFLELLPLVL